MTPKQLADWLETITRPDVAGDWHANITLAASELRRLEGVEAAAIAVITAMPQLCNCKPGSGCHVADVMDDLVAALTAKGTEHAE